MRQEKGEKIAVKEIYIYDGDDNSGSGDGDDAMTIMTNKNDS